MKRSLQIAAALLVSIAAVSCSSPAKPKAGVTLNLGGKPLLVELALNDADRERGLMFRDSLEDGKGMLFVFPSDQRLNFWMKNTKVPLSIAYISHDGTIREIYDMKPYSLDSTASSSSVRYALEVPQGYFSRIGVKPGDRIELPESLR
jgi:uncharacterized protein